MGCTTSNTVNIPTTSTKTKPDTVQAKTADVVVVKNNNESAEQRAEREKREKERDESNYKRDRELAFELSKLLYNPETNGMFKEHEIMYLIR